jgi:hypothetical protein
VTVIGASVFFFLNFAAWSRRGGARRASSSGGPAELAELGKLGAESVDFISHACPDEEEDIELAIQSEFVEKALVLVAAVWLAQPYLGREHQRGRCGRPHLLLSRYQLEV